MEVREATIKDVKHIANMVKKQVIKEAGFDFKIGINYNSMEQAKTIKYYKEIIDNEFGLTLVVLEYNKIIGYLNAYVIEKNNIFKYDVAFINGMYALDEEAYPLLLDEFEKWSKDCKVKYVKTKIYQRDELTDLYKQRGYGISVIELEKKLGE